jgi:cold shock CspA family protein
MLAVGGAVFGAVLGNAAIRPSRGANVPAVGVRFAHQTARAPAVAMMAAGGEDEPLVKGTCKWFSCEKGFGFIQIDGEDKDVFVHQSDIYAPGFRSLADGEPVEFKLINDERNGKAKAVEVTGPDGAYVQGAPKQEPYYGGGDGGEEDYY